MSCNGCRVLRKGCSESCILRPCLQWIDGAQAQSNATVFVAKFFGRAALMSFISAVPDHHRSALFQSLLLEACGRTVNPVNGAVGLLWTGNWHVCQEAVETVLRGGTIRPMSPDSGNALGLVRASMAKGADVAKLQQCDLGLCLTQEWSDAPETPSMESDESVTTNFMSGSDQAIAGGDRKMLDLFV